MFRKIVEKSAVKTDIQLEKRTQIGLCRKISNLYKVSSSFNVCLSFTKQVHCSEKLRTFVVAEQSHWKKDDNRLS